MLNKSLIILAATITLVGCSSTKAPPVVLKPGSYTALTIPVFTDLWANGVAQFATKNKNGCGEFSGNVLPASPDQDFNLDIEGDRDIFFHISRADAQVACNKYGIFYATKGNEYILNLDTKNQQCEISLIEKTPKGTQSKINTYPAHESKVDGIKVCQNKDRLY